MVDIPDVDIPDIPKSEDKPSYIISAYNLPKIAYNLLMLLVVAFATGRQIYLCAADWQGELTTYKYETAWDYVDTGLVALIGLQMILTLFSAFISDFEAFPPQHITHPKYIALWYMKTFFLLDLMFVFPFGLWIPTWGKVIKLVIVFRLIQIKDYVAFYKIYAKLQEFGLVEGGEVDDEFNRV